jgi:hypothetical protein
VLVSLLLLLLLPLLLLPLPLLLLLLPLLLLLLLLELLGLTLRLPLSLLLLLLRALSLLRLSLSVAWCCARAVEASATVRASESEQAATYVHAALFKFVFMAFLRVWPVRESVRCKRRVASAVKLRARAGPIRHAGRAIADEIYTRPASQSRTLKACHGKRSLIKRASE